MCEALIPRLAGARLEKIQAPAPDVVCLSFYAQGQKLHLLLQYGRRASFLCPVKERPAASSSPPARIMSLRGQVQGRRARHCVALWPQRCLYVLFSGESEDDPRPRWLGLDLRDGPRLEHWDCPSESIPVRWPSSEELSQAMEAWRDWPALTPALRRTLPLLEVLEQQALLADLAVGGGDVFVYGRDAKRELFAWPLPHVLRKGREEHVFSDVLEAASLVGTARIFGSLAAAERETGSRAQRREAQRLRRLLEKLDAEEVRLRDMADKQREGLAIRAQLWRYAPDEKIDELILDSPEGSLRIRPDPRYSLREHMERLFRDAGRGRRGLALLEQRRAELRARLAQADAALRLEQGKGYAGPAEEPASRARVRDRHPVAPQKARNYLGLPANVQAFMSSDGIVMLRGRDAKGNSALLRLARPYDLWMHVEGGPGAHVLIRRGPGEDIPSRSLHEAANLALVKSWRRACLRGDVMCAQARHVRPAKGGKPGTVLVDKVECALELPLDPGIELRVTRL